MLSLKLLVPSLLTTVVLSTSWADQGITGPVHGDHVGEIVWSKSAIDFKSPDASSFIDEFEANDFIYGRVYLEKALNNYTVYSGDSEGDIFQGGYEIKAIINDEPVELDYGVFHSGKLTGDAADQWTSWRFSPLPQEPKGGFQQDVASAWVKAVRNLPEGDHDVRFEIWATQGQFKSKEPIAAGEFVLALKEGDRITSGVSFPEDSYGGSDLSNLKESMRKALLSGHVAKGPDEVLDIAVRSEWQSGIYKNKLPATEYRRITGMTLWHDTNNDNICRYVSYNYIQDKLSSGWSPLRVQGFCTSCEEGDVECPN